jgi:hypothetical protein
MLSLMLIKLLIFHEECDCALMSQGQMLEINLLESRLLDTFFRNLDCSTEKWHLLDRKKYAVRTYIRTFEQLIKKSATARNFEQMTKLLRQ